MAAGKRMCVIGSLNIDVVMSTDRLPKKGETVPGNTFDVFTGGGKGANQAFALARLGADVLMVGKLGESFFGRDYVEVLTRAGVDCSGVALEPGYPGIGLILVDGDGDNVIVVYPGANAKVDHSYIDSLWDGLVARDIFLFQLEIPQDVTSYAMGRLREAGKTIIFDPAPVREVPDSMLAAPDFVTPNETELESLTGISVEDEGGFHKAGRALLARGARCVVAKAGKRGAYIIDAGGMTHVPAFTVKAVDPTAAGDSFNAGFAYGLASGMGVPESARFANAVGGLSTTAMGAQTAMPALEQVRKLLARAERGL